MLAIGSVRPMCSEEWVYGDAVLSSFCGRTMRQLKCEIRLKSV